MTSSPPPSQSSSSVSAPAPTAASGAIANGQQDSSNSSHVVRDALRQIERFANGLAEVLNDITALEVNTMVVSQITGAKFLPEETYRQLYSIHMDASDERYDRLRQSFRAICRDCMQKLSMPMLNGQLIDPENPTEQAKLQSLLNDGEFLRNLRKLAELIAVARTRSDDQVGLTDIIYAQTVIQLDGDVINRFHEKLLSNEITPQNREFLLSVHTEAVQSGEDNWRGLLKFLFDLVQDIIVRRGTQNGSN